MSSAPRAASWAAVLLAFLPACSQGPEEPSVRLRLQYDVGDTLRYEYTVTGTMTRPDSTVAGGYSRETYERTLRVDEVATGVTPGGNYLLNWTYHVPARPGGEQSSVPTSFTIGIESTPQGRIVDLENVETARPVFGNLDFRTYLEQTQPVFPERRLEIGDSWTQEVRVLSPEAEPVLTSSTYVLETFRQIDGETIAVIAFDGNVYLPVVYEDGAESGEGLQSVEERIGVRGRLYFAHERGLVQRVESSAEAEITKVSLSAGKPVRREYQISQSSELRLVEP